ESYVYYMKTLYPTMPINLNNLTIKSLVNLADPFLWYSLYSQLYYVVKGTPLDVSMFPFFGKSGYLPVFQLALAPYGPEFYFQNYFRTAKGSPIMVYGKWGSLAHNLHWGVGFEAPYLIRTPQQTLGFKFDYFDQYEPNADLTFEEAGEESSFEYQGVHRISGYAFSFIGTQSFDRFPSSGLYLQAGFKTEGYLPGESLKAGLIARAGFSITF
ncbi:MAG: hypothetical protein K9M13_03085, partial [Simkaniaceae bacterium]|nr:hypothetical protein [Simkaniaceae bacterium]